VSNGLARSVELWGVSKLRHRHLHNPIGLHALFGDSFTFTFFLVLTARVTGVCVGKGARGQGVGRGASATKDIRAWIKVELKHYSLHLEFIRMTLTTCRIVQ
jgi:hypothetical protein